MNYQFQGLRMYIPSVLPKGRFGTEKMFNNSCLIRYFLMKDTRLFWTKQPQRAQEALECEVFSVGNEKQLPVVHYLYLFSQTVHELPLSVLEWGVLPGHKWTFLNVVEFREAFDSRSWCFDTCHCSLGVIRDRVINKHTRESNFDSAELRLVLGFFFQLATKTKNWNWPWWSAK